MPNTGTGHRRLPTSAAAATTVDSATSAAQAGSRRLQRPASRSPSAPERAPASTVDRLPRPGSGRGGGAPAVKVFGTSGAAVAQADGDPSVGGQVGEVALRGGAGQAEPFGEVGRGDRRVAAAESGDDELGGVAGSPLAQRGLDAVALVQRAHRPVDVGLVERALAPQVAAVPRVGVQPLGKVGLGERLDQVVDHAAAQRVADDHVFGGGGQHDHVAVQLGDDGGARSVGQVLVEQGKVRTQPLSQLDRLAGAVGDPDDLEARHLADEPRVQVRDPEVVVHDEHPDHAVPPTVAGPAGVSRVSSCSGHRSSVSTTPGSRATNTAPQSAPDRRVSSRSPPCRRATWRASASPMPCGRSPSAWVVTPGWNSRSARSAGTPSPLSTTTRCRVSASASTETSTQAGRRVPPAAAAVALSTKLPSAVTTSSGAVSRAGRKESGLSRSCTPRSEAAAFFPASSPRRYGSRSRPPALPPVASGSAASSPRYASASS